MTNVYIVSAPSGSGKSTLLRRVLARDDRLLFSISYTTRAPRGAEKPGESYHYIPRSEFEQRVERDEFLEWAEVFGNYYGTHRGYYDQAKATGKDLVLDIDVQGARQLRGKIPDAVSIFILAPSREILEQRLRARSEDPDEVIARRLRKAAEEIRNYHDYEYVLVNHEIEKSAADLAAIFRVQRLRRMRMEDKIQPILATFSDPGNGDRTAEEV
jgi:guanylate kinase